MFLSQQVPFSIVLSINYSLFLLPSSLIETRFLRMKFSEIIVKGEEAWPKMESISTRGSTFRRIASFSARVHTLFSSDEISLEFQTHRENLSICLSPRNDLFWGGKRKDWIREDLNIEIGSKVRSRTMECSLACFFRIFYGTSVVLFFSFLEGNRILGR